ncbi:MAG: hypothetical protein HQK59_14375 [Deltaproteobacteria bacterium]|nr:hypothetical protein [Deltaproteobacteria bacterium]MBF0526252.1 hypothetical protein [Deltaproteobacteria bacterium]
MSNSAIPLDEQAVEIMMERILARWLADPKRLSDIRESIFMAQLAQHGGSFDWLKDEPDIYSDNDIEESL